ncbi:MAG: CBS domain-containing protein [Myxococcales bacterium]|nr:CBS domain-containing protein [Myxococcales bacterium]
MTVEDLMTTGVMTLRARDEISQANVEMKLGNIRHLPVVDEKGHVVGIVSNRDVMRALGRSGRAKKLPVSKVMTREVITVRPETPAHRAAEIMLDRKIGALPVVGEGEQLVGIVTESDFVAVAQELLASGTGRSAR